ncbi:MAG: RimK family alpha-L-glutamate ligase [Planctomycetes bacterium]|nr:RimK family alpha-L-glutamate ligase [Planctomycetota bacterium]
MARSALLVTRNRFLYASRRIAQEAKARGVELEIVNPSGVGVSLSEAGVVSQIKTDATKALLRFAAGFRAQTLLAGEILEASGIEVVNSTQATQLSSSKIRSALALSKASIPTLESVVVQTSAELDFALEALGEFPIVAKREFGSQGEGVFLLESRRAASSVMASLLAQGPLVLQHFVAEAEGQDLRVFVVEGQVLAGVLRQGVAGDFRANFHQGASLTPYLDNEASELALKAIQTLDLRYGGVDLIKTSAGWRVLEVNSSPGFRGLEEATDISVAGALVEAFFL